MDFACVDYDLSSGIMINLRIGVMEFDDRMQFDLSCYFFLKKNFNNMIIYEKKKYFDYFSAK